MTSLIDWIVLYVMITFHGGVDHTKSTYKNIASSDHTKSTYKTRSQKSTYKKKGPKKTVLKLIFHDHKKSLICSDHIGPSHKLTYKSVIATYKVWSATYKRLRLSHVDKYMANTGLLHIDKYLPNTGLLHIDKYMPNTGLVHVDKYMANTGILHIDKYI